MPFTQCLTRRGRFPYLVTLLVAVPASWGGDGLLPVGVNHGLDYILGVSFLPRTKEGAYAQMPYEEITEAQYRAMMCVHSNRGIDRRSGGGVHIQGSGGDAGVGEKGGFDSSICVVVYFQ